MWNSVLVPWQAHSPGLKCRWLIAAAWASSTLKETFSASPPLPLITLGLALTLVYGQDWMED